MSASVDIWITALCKPDPGYGGWAFVRRNAEGAIAGAAGGERRTNGAKMALTSVIEALAAVADLPADTAVTLHFTDPALASELVTADGAWATGESDAWTAARKAVAARPVLSLSPLSDATPIAGFLKAWADFGLDTSKTRGTFKAAIPRPNLMKFPS